MGQLPLDHDIMVKKHRGAGWRGTLDFKAGPIICILLLDDHLTVAISNILFI